MPWYNASWLYRVKITVQNSKVDANLTGYPVYLNLADMPAGFHTNVNQTDGRDIRITTSDGTTEVPVEVVYYTSGSDTGEVHFKGDLLNSTDVDFYVYYGNAAASMPAANATYGKYNVWDSNYLMVLHYGNGSTLSIADSTSYQRSLTNNNTVTAGAGQVGGAAYFAKTSSQYLEVTDHSDFRSLPALSMEAWAYLVSVDTDGYFIFTKNVSNATPTDPYEDYAMFGDTSRNMIFRTASSPTTGWTDATQAAAYMPLTTWTQFFSTYDGTTMRQYKNGTVSGTTASKSGNLGNTVQNPRIGTFIQSGFNYDLDGRMDELRISKIARAGTWISTQYNNHSSASTFYAVGSQEANSTPGTLTNIISISNISTIKF